jgi:hypothetical protein
MPGSKMRKSWLNYSVTTIPTDLIELERSLDMEFAEVTRGIQSERDLPGIKEVAEAIESERDPPESKVGADSTRSIESELAPPEPKSDPTFLKRQPVAKPKSPARHSTTKSSKRRSSALSSATRSSLDNAQQQTDHLSTSTSSTTISTPQTTNIDQDQTRSLTGNLPLASTLLDPSLGIVLERLVDEIDLSATHPHEILEALSSQSVRTWRTFLNSDVKDFRYFTKPGPDGITPIPLSFFSIKMLIQIKEMVRENIDKRVVDARQPWFYTAEMFDDYCSKVQSAKKRYSHYAIVGKRQQQMVQPRGHQPLNIFAFCLS